MSFSLQLMMKRGPVNKVVVVVKTMIEGLPRKGIKFASVTP